MQSSQSMMLVALVVVAVLFATASADGGSGSGQSPSSTGSSNSGPGSTPVLGGCNDEARRRCEYSNLRACNATQWPMPWGTGNPCCPSLPNCRLPQGCTQETISQCSVSTVCAAGTVPTRSGAASCCPSCRVPLPRPDGCTVDPATLPLCPEGAVPTRDATTGCANCRPEQGRNGNCTLDSLRQCAATVASLPACDGEQPNRRGEEDTVPGPQACCLNCMPDFERFCNASTIKTCENNFASLPDCSTTPSALSDGKAAFDSKKCCRKCRRPIPPTAQRPDANGQCTKAQIKTCFENQPICDAGERPHVDAANFCCPSCKRPQRLCALEDVVRCQATVPDCATGEQPVVVAGECCPTCRPVRPTCTCTDTTQICVYLPNNGAAGSNSPATFCADKKTVTFTITPNADNSNALANMTPAQIRFLLFEIVARWCDQNANALLCRRRESQIRNSEINGVQNADGTLTVTVSFPVVSDNNDDGTGGVPVISSGGMEAEEPSFLSFNAKILSRVGASSASGSSFSTMAAADDIYVNAALNAEAAAGYTATNTGGNSAASGVTPSSFALAAVAVAAVLAARRF